MMRFVGYSLWGAFATLAILISTLPLGVEAQLMLSGAALCAMLLIKSLRLRGPFRSILLGLGIFVVLRYVMWRLSSTLPTWDSPLDFTAGLILVCAECYCIVMLFLSLFTVIDPMERPVAPRLRDEDAPTVDVFVPSYNESIDIVAPTLAAAKRLIYPAGKLNVFLLDDGGTNERVASDDSVVAARALNRRQSLQALCVELGVRYLTRDDNTHAKAGNLNHGLANSDGDLVVVFDADHAPSQEFLRETVGYFSSDEKLFLVQTPHFFLNRDPVERNLGAERMPAENEMFYRLVQKGLDKWNAAFFCGSAAVLRRQALEQVGGFHGSSITEDAESALELHARGWSSLYVDKPMIAGLQPETFASFIGQRSRWCRGMVQILLMKNPLFKNGLSLAQRLCYLSSSLFWLFPLSRMIFIFAPMMYIFFDMKIYRANSQEFIAYTMTYMISALLIQNYMFGKFRWPWASDLYEYIQAVLLFPAVLGVFVDPRRPKFNVTAKGQTLEENQLSNLAWPYFAIFGLVAASIAVLVYRYVNEPNARDLMTVVGIWSGLNLCLTGVALGAVSERRERRSVPRVPSQVKATLAFGAEDWPVQIEDMSFGGLRIRAIGSTQVPPRGTGVLRLEGAGPGSRALEAPVSIVGRRISDDARGIGLRFYGVGGDRFRIVAKVIYSTIEPIYAGQRNGYAYFGVLRGSLRIVSWWFTHTGRGLFYGLFRRNLDRPAGLSHPTERSAA